MALMRLLILPLRAPMLLVLFATAVVMGNHWTLLHEHVHDTRGVSIPLFWTVELLQSVVVVVICSLPDLFVRRVSLLMASSRVLSLVVILLLVITLGIYALRLHLFADILIISSAVLLARLDLTRIGVVPPAALTVSFLLCVLLSGICIGHLLPDPRTAWFAIGIR